ncbi:MAG: hypothetical protein WCI57_00130 [Candidatus Berkelbacteria bacterium]
MNIFKKILLVCLALATVLLDVSFFSAFEIYGATIISSLAVLLTMAITDRSRNYLIYVFSLILFFTIFSSLPLLVIALEFLALPVGLNYVMTRYFPRPKAVTSPVYYLFGNFIFELVLLVYSKEYNQAGLLTLSYFVVLNSILGVIFYILQEKVKNDFNIEEIKA